jgi:hypothetical protein
MPAVICLARANFLGYSLGEDFTARIRARASDTHVLDVWTTAAHRGQVAPGTFDSFRAGWRFAE